MIRVMNLTKNYGKKEVLKGITVSLQKDTYGLIGPNGAGKTTFLRILAGIFKQNSGEITMENKAPLIGYLPQKYGCFPELTVYEQLEYFACLKNLPRNQHEKEIKRVIKLVNLENQEKEKCSKLSGGMIRRVGIAQAMLGTPELLLLDEPTVGLDPEERNHFNNIIHRLHGETTIILSTHLVEDIKSLCNNVMVMNDGMIVKNDSAQNIASLAQNRVIELEESKIKELDSLQVPYYIERYFSKNEERFLRVLLLEKILTDKKYDNYCESDLEDGYLYLLKGLMKNE